MMIEIILFIINVLRLVICFLSFQEAFHARYFFLSKMKKASDEANLLFFLYLELESNPHSL